MRAMFRNKHTIRITALLILLAFAMTCFTGCGSDEDEMSPDEEQYAVLTEVPDALSAYYAVPYLETAHLCAASTDILPKNAEIINDQTALGLFDINNAKVVEAYQIHQKLYPASITKIMTAYLALTYGELGDNVTVPQEAVELEEGSMLSGLIPGDVLTLNDLLYALLLQSGNDAAVTIAVHIAGSVPAFVQMMNETAHDMGATNTHFMNPHGLHDENHYTTAYDLYLIFSHCLELQGFRDIIEQKSYSATITSSIGNMRSEVWYATNYYAGGGAFAPDGVRVLGGKTGTTDEAGSCLILLSEDLHDNPYISIVLHSPDKSVLYDSMNVLLSLIIQ